jgi:hypothetical protein
MKIIKGRGLSASQAGETWAFRMRSAATAAPNPLSMFTTVNPLAQEFSMVSRAEKPLK